MLNSRRMVVTLGLGCVLGLMVVWQQVRLTRLGYELSALQRETQTLEEEARALAATRESVADETALARVARRAQLPIVPPEAIGKDRR